MKRNRGQSSAMKCSRAPVEGDPRPYRAIRRFAWPAQTECAKSVFLGEKPRAYSVAATAASRSEERRAPGKKRFCAASASASRYTGLCTHTRRRPAHVGARGQPQGTKPWHQAMAPGTKPEAWDRELATEGQRGTAEARDQQSAVWGRAPATHRRFFCRKENSSAFLATTSAESPAAARPRICHGGHQRSSTSPPQPEAISSHPGRHSERPRKAQAIRAEDRMRGQSQPKATNRTQSQIAGTVRRLAEDRMSLAMSSNSSMSICPEPSASYLLKSSIVLSFSNASDIGRTTRGASQTAY